MMRDCGGEALSSAQGGVGGRIRAAGAEGEREDGQEAAVEIPHTSTAKPGGSLLSAFFKGSPPELQRACDRGTCRATLLDMTPATAWKDMIPEGEPARLERHAENLLERQRRRAGGHKALRGLHAKGNAGLEAELTVLSDFPEPLRVGLFAAPATYRSYVRFSNGSGLIQHDKAGDIRGAALKVVGVEGKKIIPGMEDARTQDFLLIRSPSTPFRNADEFVGFVLAAESRALLLPRAVKLFGFGTTL